ncbi:MAG: hypothetical protein ACXVW9_12470 [Nocardioidaceae bacterium]
MSNKEARMAVQELATAQDGVVSRAQARELGVDHWAVAHEVRSGRWAVYGDDSVAVHRQPLGFRARCRVAVWEAGCHAVLDGSTALTFRGLRNFDDGIHVLKPWPGSAEGWDGTRVHSSRLWRIGDIEVFDGLPCTKPDVATIRAAMWARSERAAATIMARAVQQRLTTGAAVLLEARRLNRHKRRPLILQVAADIADGAQALGELDFAGMCRRRGLPKPDRQVIRSLPGGRAYLDNYWDALALVVEVDGVHHDAPENAIADALRQNALTIAKDDVLRVPVLGLRVCPDLFMDQVAAMLEAAGWRPTAPPTTESEGDPSATGAVPITESEGDPSVTRAVPISGLGGG